MALLEVIERKRLTYSVDYRSIAIRHGVKCGSLRALYVKFKKGLVDLGDPQTPEEKQIDAKVQMEKQTGLLRRYKGLLLVRFEGALYEAEDAMTKGNVEAWRQMGLPALRSEIKATDELIQRTEEGFIAILDEYRAQDQNRQKHLNAPQHPSEDVAKQVASANDEALALRALEAIDIG